MSGSTSSTQTTSSPATQVTAPREGRVIIDGDVGMRVADVRGAIVGYVSDRVGFGRYLDTDVFILRDCGYINASRLCAMR
jgi:hypothetical protein